MEVTERKLKSDQCGIETVIQRLRHKAQRPLKSDQCGIETRNGVITVQQYLR